MACVYMNDKVLKSDIVAMATAQNEVWFGWLHENCLYSSGEWTFGRAGWKLGGGGGGVC